MSSGDFDHAVWHRWAADGLTGLVVPVELGGGGADAHAAALRLAALGYECTDNGMLFSLGAHLWSAVTPILRFGSPVQQQRYLPGMCEGSVIGVQGMTEPDSGSDAFALCTTAIADGDAVVLHGSKTFITNAPIADVLVVFATSEAGSGWAGLSAYLVDRDADGLSIGEPLRTLGLASSQLAEVHLDGVRVAAEDRLGPEGAGMAVFLHSMEWERSLILAPAVGTMQRQAEQAAHRARHLGSHASRAVASEVVLRARLARLLLDRVTRRRVLALPRPGDAALLKLGLAEAWIACSVQCLELAGSAGLLEVEQATHDLRDALASRIYSGTSEIQRDLLGHALGLPD